MNKIIIIGGSAAGMSFAAKYHRNLPNDQILLFEAHEYISFGACGLPYYVQDQFSDKKEMFARTPNQMIDSGIDVRVNTKVTEINSDEKFVIANEEKHSYDKLIIATGATPIVPDFATVDSENVFTLTTMADGEALKHKMSSGIKHVTVVGAGFIGLEVVDSARHLGIDVTLVERASNILSAQFGSNMTNVVEENLTDHDVELQLGTTVSKIEITLEDTTVYTEKGNFKTDAVVLAIGFRPNSSLLDCNKLSNGAIVVNENGETSITDVYAVGDVATTINLQTGNPMYLPLATNANKFAKSLADSLAGIEHTFNGMLGSSCIKVMDYDMARTGMTEAQLSNEKIDYKVKVLKDKTHTSYYEGQEDIYIKLIYEPETLVILGAEIVGKKDVVHRLDVLALAISMNVTTKQLAYIDFAYAPPFARTWEALNTAGNISK